MIYPIDVNSRVKRSGKMTTTDKVKIGLGLLLMVNVIFTIFLSGIFTSMGIPLWVIIVVQVVLFLIVFVMVFRFAIFREQDRVADEGDIFLQYYKFRPGHKLVRLAIGEIPFLELKNSLAVGAIRLKFGSNDAVKKVATESFLRSCVNLLGEKGLSSRILVMTERFMDTPEFNTHLQRVNKITEPKLRNSLLEVYSNTFVFCEANSSAETLVLMVYASSSFLKDELEDAMVQIDALFKANERLHAFRSHEFLDSVELLEIFRDFYGMGAIDLSLSKIQLQATDPDVLKSVLVYRIISEEGKTFTSPIFDKIRTRVQEIN